MTHQKLAIIKGQYQFPHMSDKRVTRVTARRSAASSVSLLLPHRCMPSDIYLKRAQYMRLPSHRTRKYNVQLEVGLAVDVLKVCIGRPDAGARASRAALASVNEQELARRTRQPGPPRQVSTAARQLSPHGLHPCTSRLSLVLTAWGTEFKWPVTIPSRLVALTSWMDPAGDENLVAPEASSRVEDAALIYLNFN